MVTRAYKALSLYTYGMGEVNNEQLVEHIFRHEYGKIVSFLTYKFGPSQLEVIEDAVQEALLKAMQVWGYGEPPKNPTAWLLKVAQNRVIDTLRKKKHLVHVDVLLPSKNSEPQKGEVLLNTAIGDSQLKMIFACCHPSLSAEYQIILSLKLIAGFGNREIAQALFKKEETVAKSFTRAKRRLQDKVRTLDIPLELGLQSRLKIVLKVIYLLFSEGYATRSGSGLIKKDICMEAIRLALLLTDNKYCDTPEVHALIALMCFHASRFDARIDSDGNLVDLENQDRSLYERELINIGIYHLEDASVKENPSDYHLQAAISYYHCTAKNFDDTNWQAILQLYDLQLARSFSPIAQLNRLVPFHRVFGAEKAMKSLRDFEKSPYFIDNALFNAIKAELLLELKDLKGSKLSLQRAIDRTHNEMERNHLYKKLRALDA
ncbi:MAG: sigma-70 family RNA polymerase sigma factor [Maribacter sp.]